MPQSTPFVQLLPFTDRRVNLNKMAFYSASQRFFHIPEMLQLVFDELPIKADLFSAALTSRAFCEPALDKLWRHVEFLEPIIACLPEDLFVWEEESEELTVLVI